MAGEILIASGVGDDPPGGLYAFEDGGVTVLDGSDTTGLAVSPDGAALARLLFTDDDPQTAGELLVYDAAGVAAYRRIDALQEPHAIAWHDGRWVAVSTLSNTFMWLDVTGSVVDARFMGGDGGDAWHLNNVLVHEGRLLASAFGRFDTHRGWNAPGARRGAGIVFDVTSGEDVITGLTCPHDPLYLDGAWLVCDSGTAALWRMAPDGTPADRIDLGGWTRGLAYDEERLYVGVSANRLSERTGAAEIAVLDRRSLAEVDRLRLPCREVFALVWVSAPLLEGLRTGFAVNPEARAAAGVFATAGWTADMPAPVSDGDRAAYLVVDGIPASAPAGEFVALRWTLENRGRGRLSSRAANPVLVGARWLGPDGAPLAQEARARLPRTVGPGETVAGVLRVAAPRAAGRHRLIVSVVEEHVAWFDAGTEADVDVAPSAWTAPA